MSDNYRLYAKKMADLKAHRANRPLRRQLGELMKVVQRCEAIWALEERLDRMNGVGDGG